MLYTQLLRDKLHDLLSDASTLAAAADRLAAEEDVFFSTAFCCRAPFCGPSPPTNRCAADRRD